MILAVVVCVDCLRSDEFWSRAVSDVGGLASHAGRSVVERADVELLMHRSALVPLCTNESIVNRSLTSSMSLASNFSS